MAAGALLALCTPIQVAAQPVPKLAAAPDWSPVRGLQAFMTTFAPGAADLSLLGVAQRQGLDWPATQNLFSARLTDESAHFLDWRGHSRAGSGSVFTTVRAATYLRPSQALLVLNRQWCAQGQCQEQTAFAWLGAAGTLTPAQERDLIPLIRDRDFFPGSVPPCLRGVTLSVSYLPARQGPALHALPLLPPATARACAAARVNVATVTQPLRLTWDPAAGKFRR